MNIFFKVGRTFGYKGVLLKVVKQDPDKFDCTGCYWENDVDSCGIETLPLVCCSKDREDGRDIIFKEVKKCGKK